MTSEIELHSHAAEYGRAYQQGHGHQYNIAHALFENGETRQQILSFGSIPVPLVREADPLELGVHRATILNGNAVPIYIPRDIDDELTRKIADSAARGGFVIIVGDSTAGKTRSAYEALLRVVPDYRLIHPYDRAELIASFATIAMSPRGTVLWLDNIERYIESNGLTPRIAVQLKRMGVICIGTIRSEKYRGLTSLSIDGPNVDSRSHEELIAVEHVLDLTDIILMDRKWSQSEVSRAMDADDLRVTEAWSHRQNYGLAEYLAAGPKLYQEFSLAPIVGGNPRGAALVNAAIDCQRAGVYGSIPLEVLRSVHEYYLDLAGGSLLRPESFEHAVAWATGRRYGVTSLLIPGKNQGSYRAFDYLVDRISGSEERSSVPDIVWGALRQHFSANAAQLNVIAIAAVAQDKGEIAVEIWQELAEQQDGVAARSLGRLFGKSGDHEKAVTWYKKAVEFGNVAAAVALGHILEYEYPDRMPEAESWYEHAARNEDPHGMYHMGLICQSKGLKAEAEDWFRKAIDRKELIASSGLGELLVSSGRMEEAETLLRDAADEGDLAAMVSLGRVYKDLRRDEEAEQIWLRAAREGSASAKARLGIHYSDLKRDRESEAFFLEAIADGSKGALGSYTHFLGERRRWVEADKMGRQTFEAGDTAISACMAEMLCDGRRFRDAENWYKIALQTNESRAVLGMAWLMDRVGRKKEAAVYWQRLADEGDTRASFALGKIKLGEGDLDSAIPHFQTAAEEEHDEMAACELGRIYWGRGDFESAEVWLKKSHEARHDHATCLLGTLYENQGIYELAEQYWEIAYKERGHVHVAGNLSSMLAKQGRGKEAADWLARSKGINKGKNSQEGSRNRRRRRR